MRAAHTSIILATCGLLLPASFHTRAGAALAEPADAATPAADAPKIPKASAEQIAATQAAIAALVEQYQPVGGRNKSGPNAYTSLIDALDAMQRVSQLVWRGENGTTRDGATPPDFTMIYSGRDSDRNTPEYSAAMAQIAVLRASELGAHLDAVAATQRSVRPVQRTKEHDRLMLATGTSPASDTAGSGYLFEMLLPELGAMRFIARYNVAVMYLAAADGDTDSVLRAVEHNLALARVSGHNWTLIDRLVSHAIVALTMDYTSRLVEAAFLDPASAGASRLTDPKFLAALDGVIARQIGSLPPMSYQIAGEKLQFMDILPLVYGTGETAQPGGWDRLGVVGFAKPQNTAAATRSKEVASADAYYGALMKFADAPWEDAKGMLSKFEDGGELGPQKLTPLLGMVAPAITRSRASGMQVASTVTGLRTMLAIRLHEAKTGSLPASLSDLKPQALAAAMDPYTGILPGYRQVDAKRFDLWVAGYDGKDDGGVFDTVERYSAASGKPGGAGKDFRVFPPVD